jgi:uridine kinase|tara:strand:- start:695 stop:1318 length:624 start_codon:yes stop_codon:yes gene_type:complete
MSRTIIGISGGSCSGKSAISQKFHQSFGNNSIVICQDAFYRSLSQKELKNIGNYDFDVPDAIDFRKLEKVLIDIKSGKDFISIPIYDFKTHTVTGDNQIDLTSVKIVILEGILLYYFKFIRDMINIRIFVDTDSDVRLSRRIKRDIEKRARSLSMILERYNKFVKPSYEKYVKDTKKYSNLIIPFGVENYPFLDVFCHIFCKYTHKN